MAAPVGTLATLVKLAKHKVEKAQDALAVAEREQMRLDQWLSSTQQAREQALTAALKAEAAVERMDAGRYDNRLAALVETIQTDLAKSREQVAACMEALREAYAVQKQYEVLLEQERLKSAKARAARQQRQLDDIASSRYGRR